MVYSIRLPDGQVVGNIPDDVKPEDAKAKIDKQFPQFAKPQSGALVSGFASYAPQLQETYGGIKTLLGVGAERLGATDTARALIQSGALSMKEAEEKQAPLATAERTSFSDALSKGVGSVLTEWLPYQVGSGAANVLESLAVTGAGALAGSAIPGAGTLAGAATGLVAKKLAKEGLKEAAETILKERGEDAAKEYVEQATKRASLEVAKDVGAYGALGSQALFYGAGQTTSRAVEEAERLGGTATDIELARVLPASAVSALAEFVGDKITLGALKGTKGPSQNLALNIAKQIALTGTKEAPVEVIQSAAERFGAKLSLADAAAVKEYIDSAASAYAMSVVPGTVGGIRTQAPEQGELVEGQLAGESLRQAAERTQQELLDLQALRAEQDEADKQAEQTGISGMLAAPASVAGRAPSAARPSAFEGLLPTAPEEAAPAGIASMLEAPAGRASRISGPANISSLMVPTERALVQEAGISSLLEAPEGRQVARSTAQTPADFNALLAQAEATLAPSVEPGLSDVLTSPATRATPSRAVSPAAFDTLLAPDVAEATTPGMASIMEAIAKPAPSRAQGPLSVNNLLAPEVISAPAKPETAKAGAKPVAAPVSPPVREGVQVAGEQVSTAPATGFVAPKPAGVAVAEQAVGRPAGGEGAQPAPLAPETGTLTNLAEQLPERKASLRSVVADPVRRELINNVNTQLQSLTNFVNENGESIQSVNTPLTPQPIKQARQLHRQLMSSALSMAGRVHAEVTGAPTTVMKDVPSLEKDVLLKLKKAQEFVPVSKKSLAAPAAAPEVATEAAPEATAKAATEPTVEPLDAEIATKTKQLGNILVKIMSGMGLRDVGLNLATDLRGANAEYSAKLIRLALDADSPVRDLRHESIHAMKALGFFSDKQWATLEQMARDKWIPQFLGNVNVGQEALQEGEQSRLDAYRAMFKAEGKTDAEVQEAIIEEAIADAFGNFDIQGAPAGMLSAILKRMQNMFAAIKSAMGGDESAEQILRKAEKGQLKGKAAPVEGGAAKSSLRGKYRIEKTETDDYKTGLPKAAWNVVDAEDGYVYDTFDRKRDASDWVANAESKEQPKASLRAGDKRGKWYVDATSQQQATLDKWEDERTAGSTSNWEDLDVRPSREDIYDSASGFFNDYEKANGLFDIPLADIGPLTGYDNAKDKARIQNLADQIKENGEIEPVFVAVDPDGESYLMEGQHRSRALELLGYKSVPARVIVSMDEVEQPKASLREKPSLENAWKASTADKKKAAAYAEENGIEPYISEGRLDLPTKFSLKLKEKKGYGMSPLLGIPMNKDGTVTVYYHTTKSKTLDINSKKMIPSEGRNRIYVTNESSGARILGNRGNFDQELDGSTVLLHLPESLLQIDQEYPDGRKDFFVPLAQGDFFNRKMQAASIQAERTKAITDVFSYKEHEERIAAAVSEYQSLDKKGKEKRLKQARAILKKEHNVGTLMTENGKLEKTRMGGLMYEGQPIDSMGLGLAAAQQISDKLSTCPNAAICEGLCLGETSGGNLVYGGAAQEDVEDIAKSAFRAGPRMMQYLKTEALIIHPEEFAIVLQSEIDSLVKWDQKTTVRKKNPETGVSEQVEKDIYQSAVRLNVTSDFRGEMWRGVIENNPNVMFYDYTKVVGNRPIAENHHLTYSSTGFGQMVDGEKVFFETKSGKYNHNWAQIRNLLNSGKNSAMAFSSKSSLPSFLFDEETGVTYKVLDGDDYDARFLDESSPLKQDSPHGVIVGLRNKASTLKEKSATKETGGFFANYDPKTDGDTVTVPTQTQFGAPPYKAPGKSIPIAKASIRAPKTKEFKQWFGDSKVVDENGNPLVVYHGTTSDFAEFDIEKSGASNRFGPGIYFTGDQNTFNTYSGDVGGNVMPVYLRINNPQIGNSLTQAQIKKFFASLQDKVFTNGFDATEAHKEFEQRALDNPSEAFETLLSAQAGYISNADWLRGMKSIGVDGLIRTVYGKPEYVVYDATQIKSAIGNTGAYSPTNPDIRKSIRAPQTKEFKTWFADSKVVDENGEPKVMFHGTARDIYAFRAKQAGAIFVTDQPGFAETFADTSADWMSKNPEEFFTKEEIAAAKLEAIKAIKASKKGLPITSKNFLDDVIALLRRSATNMSGIADEAIAYLEGNEAASKDVIEYAKEELRSQFIDKLPTGQNIMPVFVKAENPFDYDNQDDVDAILGELRGAYDYKGTNYATKYGGDIAAGNWEVIESSAVQAAIKKAGFDGFYVKENFVKNLAVYDPTQIKSAIGNQGTFDVTNPDIRKSLRSPGKPATKENVLAAMNLAHEQNPYMNCQLAVQMATGVSKIRDLPKVKSAQVGDIYTFNETKTMASHYAIELGNGKVAEIEQWGEEPREVPLTDLTAEYDEPSAIRRPPETAYTGAAQPAKASLRSTLPRAIVQRIDQTTTAREDKGFIGRMLQAISPGSHTSIRAELLNRYDALSEIDRLRIKQMGGAAAMADIASESAALMSDLGAGITASALGVHDKVGGAPVYAQSFYVVRNGKILPRRYKTKAQAQAVAGTTGEVRSGGHTTVSNFNNAVKGPLAIFAPLAKYNDPMIYQAYQFWAAVKRGKRFDTEGRELLIDAKGPDAAHAAALERRYPEFDSIQQEWIKYNNKLVQYMVDTGVLTPEKGKIYTEHSDYIPFYRQMEGDTIAGPKVFAAISGVKGPKALKGSKAALDDFLETIVRNTQAAVQAGVKNIAAQRAVEAAQDVGLAVKLPAGNGLPSTVMVMESGVPTYYDCKDALFVNALKSLAMSDIPFLNVLAMPANLLRAAVTKEPTFMLANMLRDSMSAYVTSGTNMTPVIDTAKNFAKTIAGRSPEFEALRRAGISGGYEFTQGVETSGRKFGEQLKALAGVKATGVKRLGKLAASPVTGVWNALEKGSEASDAATRIEIYKQTLAETGNETEALFRSLEVMNFNRKGRNAGVRLFTAMIPFLNARMQGLDILYRIAIRPSLLGQSVTAREKELQHTFLVRGATMAGLSAMYWFLTSDDEEYEKQEQETKDNYWLIPSLGIKIPIPFEVGVLFKVIPERVMALAFGDDTFKDFRESMTNQIISTLKVNPIPQAVIPLIENMTNYSFYTTRAIVSPGMEGLEPGYQVAPSTSTLIADTGRALNISPIKLEHAIQGYTGSMGMYLVAALDAVYDANSTTPRPSKRFEQLPLIKRFAVDPEARGSVTAFYKLKDSVDIAVKTSNMLERTGDFEAYEKYTTENMNLLASKEYVNQLGKTLKELAEMKSMIRMSEESADSKKEALLEVQQMENQLTENIQELRGIAYATD